MICTLPFAGGGKATDENSANKTDFVKKVHLTKMPARGRKWGIYYNQGSCEGDFYSGIAGSLECDFLGGEHWYAGIDFCGNNTETDVGDIGIQFYSSNFLVMYSNNIWLLRPYIAGGLVFYACSVEDAADEEPNGLAMEAILGTDILLKHLVLGFSYKLQYYSGSG